MKMLMILLTAIIMMSCYPPAKQFTAEEMTALIASEEVFVTDSCRIINGVVYPYTYIYNTYTDQKYCYYPIVTSSEYDVVYYCVTTE